MRGPGRRTFISTRIGSSLFVAGCALAAFSLLAAISAGIGANYAGPLRLLEPYRPPNGDEAFALFPIDYALASSEANDVLFIGDSTCRCGIDPRQFEKLTGRPAYNLGSSGRLGLSAQLITLREYLAHHPAPRAVVLCLTPTDILQARSDPDGIGPATTAGEIHERFLRAYGPRTERRSVLADGFGSLKYFVHRGTLVAGTLASDFLRGRTRDRRLDEPLYGFEAETYNTLHDKIRKSRGFFALPKQVGAGIIVPELATPHSVVSWMNDGVRAFARLAQQGSFRLVIRLTPISNANAPWDRECIPAWSKELERDFSQVVVSRPEILWYEPAACWDSIHLNARGVERFTALIAKDMAALLGPRKTAAAQDTGRLPKTAPDTRRPNTAAAQSRQEAG